MFPSWLGAIIFFSVLAWILSSQVFWAWQAHRLVRSRKSRWLRWLLGIPLYGWFVALLGLFLLAPIRWFALHNSAVLVSLYWQLRRSEFLLPMGLWVSASMLSSLLIALVWGTGRLVERVRRWGRNSSEDPVPERRHFLQTATYVAGALPFVMVGYGFLIGRERYHVNEVSVPLTGLPPELDGLRLLQLTDLHASAFMPVPEIRRIVGLAREIKADLVLHTGDFLTSQGDPLEAAVEELSRVEASYGRFGCLGNHEIYARATDTATKLFAERGVRILRGENVVLDINGAQLNLIGVDYQRQPRGNSLEEGEKGYLRGVEALARPGLTNILLSHNPNPFLRAVELGIDLTIAGHTHGGQVQVEILDTRWSPARFMTPFINGLYQRGGKQLYVSPGLGTVGAPVRINVPPEITLLTLRRV